MIGDQEMPDNEEEKDWIGDLQIQNRYHKNKQLAKQRADGVMTIGEQVADQKMIPEEAIEDSDPDEDMPEINQTDLQDALSDLD